MKQLTAILCLGILFLTSGCRPPGTLPKTLCAGPKPPMAACTADMQKSHQKKVDYVSVSPDGKLVVSSAQEDTLLWDVATGRLLKTFKSSSAVAGPSGMVACAFFGIRLWKNLGDKFTDVQFPNENTKVLQAAFANSGNLVVGRSRDNLHVKDMRTGKYRTSRTGEVDALKVAATGFMAVSKRSHQHVYLTDLRSMKETKLAAYDQATHGLAISPDGSLVAVGRLGGDGKAFIDVWDTKTRRRLKKLEVDSSDREGFPSRCDQCMAVGANNEVLAVGSKSRVHLWNLRTWRKVEKVLTRGEGRWGKSRAVTAVDFVGRILAAGYEDGTLKVWDVCSARSICTH